MAAPPREIRNLVFFEWTCGMAVALLLFCIRANTGREAGAQLAFAFVPRALVPLCNVRMLLPQSLEAGCLQDLPWAWDLLEPLSGHSCKTVAAGGKK